MHDPSAGRAGWLGRICLICGKAVKSPRHRCPVRDREEYEDHKLRFFWRWASERKGDWNDAERAFEAVRYGLLELRKSQRAPR